MTRTRRNFKAYHNVTLPRKDFAMLTPERITTVAKNAAHVAYTVLGLDCPYSVQIIDRRELPFDCLLRDRDNTIQLNLSHLEPFSQSVMPASDPKTEEDYELDENYRHTMKICSVVFHEMRHLYQKRAVEIYHVNRFLGAKSIKPLESDKKCSLWEQELQQYILGEGEGTNIEADANDFAYYLSNRYPINLPMLQTNRRLGAMKRKYDKVEIPEI